MISHEIKEQGDTAKTRVAVIDLGTNTFHLLIADTSPRERPDLVYQQTLAVKLGEGGIAEDNISPEAFSRGINALKEFKNHIDRLHVDLIKSAATSAIRTAKNGLEFINQAQVETGLKLTIIDGELEAKLIYQGVRAAIELDNTTLIVDIGGGSVEIIICEPDAILWKKSYPIGAARLMAEFHHSDPISADDQHRLRFYLGHILADFREQADRYQPRLMIGSAGAFETFAEFQRRAFTPSFEQPQQDIHIGSFNKTASKIIQSNHQERSSMPEIPPVRVDMIVAATLLTRFIINISNIEKLKLSYYSLKEGILFGEGI